MTNPFGYHDYSKELGSHSPIAELEWQDFMRRHKELLDTLLGHATEIATTDQQLHPDPNSAYGRMQSQQVAPPQMGQHVTTAGEDELIAQARAWGIPNPERIPPGELAEKIARYRDIFAANEADTEPSSGSRALMLLGGAAEAGGATARLVGNFLGDFKAIPFAGPMLANILGTEKAKRFMYDLNMSTAEFVENVRKAQPSEDKTATQVALATGKVAGYALPAILAWEAMGTAGAMMPPAWQMTVTKPIARVAVRGFLSSTLLEAGSDEPTSSKVFNIGFGTILGVAGQARIGASLMGGVLGAGVGAGVGDTPEERHRNTVIGGLAGLIGGAMPMFIAATRKVKQDMPSPWDIQVDQQVSIDADQQVQKMLQPGVRQGQATMSEPPGPPTEPDYVVHSDDLAKQMQQPSQLPAEVAGKVTELSEDITLPSDTEIADIFRTVKSEFERSNFQNPEIQQQYVQLAAEIQARGMDPNDPVPLWTTMKPLSVEDAIATAHTLNNQNTILESASLPGAMNRTKMGDLDVIDAALVNNPGGISIVRGLSKPVDLIESGRPVQFVQRGDKFDALVGRVTPQQAAEYQQHGIFSGQRVVSPDGIEGTVVMAHDPYIFTERGGGVHILGPDGTMLPIAARDVMVTRYSEPAIDAPELWNQFKADLIDYVNQQSVQAGQPPVQEGVTIHRGSMTPPSEMQTPAFFSNDRATAAEYATDIMNPGQRGYVQTARLVSRNPAGPEVIAKLEKDFGLPKGGFAESVIEDPAVYKTMVGQLKGAGYDSVGPLPHLYSPGKADYVVLDPSVIAPPSIEALSNSKVTSIMQPQMSAFFDGLGIQDNGVRQALEKDFNNRWVSELRGLDPESAALQQHALDAIRARGVTGLRAASKATDGSIYTGLIHSESVQAIELVGKKFAEDGFVDSNGKFLTREEADIAYGQYESSEYNPQESAIPSLEEIADKRGFIWISKPGEGGVLRDGVNPAAPDLPMETDQAAEEFLRNHDRALPDLSPTSAMPAELATMLPTGMRFEPQLSASGMAESLSRTALSLRDPLSTGGGGRGAFPPSAPPFTPRGGGGPPQLPPGEHQTLGGQFDKLRRTDPIKLNAWLDEFQNGLSRHLHYTRYEMLKIENQLVNDLGLTLGRAWEHYDALDLSRNQASNEGLPWINEWSDIMRMIPGRVIRDGTVTRLHEIEDPNARYAAWYRTMETHGLSKGQVQNALMADEKITDFMHRFFEMMTGDPSFAMTADREIFRYMPHVRARQAQGLRDPYAAEWLNPNVEFFAEFAREGNLQFRVMDARELGTYMVRSAMFKKYSEVPWANFVKAWQDPRVPQSVQDYMMDYARLSRYGYNPRGDLAVRGVQSMFRRIFRTPITPHEAQHLLNMPIGAQYMAMLAGRSSIFFRDAMQPLLALVKVRTPYMASVYGDVLTGAGKAISARDLTRLTEMYDRGIEAGWIERENPNIETVGIFENTVGEVEGELALRPGEAARREVLARIGDEVRQLPAWLVRPSESNLSTLKWYGRQGQLHRLIVGEAAYRQSVEHIAAYRRSHIEAVLNRNPAMAMGYETLADNAFFSSFEPPIQAKIRELVEAGDDEGAAKMFARQVANWSQFKYGRKEMPPMFRNTMGRIISSLGSFTGQFLEGMNSALRYGTERDQVRYWQIVGGFSAGMYGLKKLTGWSFDRWAWIPQVFQYSGGPMLDRIANGVLGLQGAVSEAGGYGMTPTQKEAAKDVLQGPNMGDYFPYSGYIKTAAELGNAMQGNNPWEQVPRYMVTGDRGSRIDFDRMMQGYDPHSGPIPPNAGPGSYTIPPRDPQGPPDGGGFFQ